MNPNQSTQSQIFFLLSIIIRDIVSDYVQGILRVVQANEKLNRSEISMETLQVGFFFKHKKVRNVMTNVMF